MDEKRKLKFILYAFSLLLIIGTLCYTILLDVELDLEEVLVKKESYLENKTLVEAEIPRKTGLTVLAIKKIEDEKMLFNPPIDYTFKIGDVLIILGREEQVDKLRNLGDEIK